MRVAKSRLFAHPRPAAYEAGGRHQIEQYSEALPEDASLSEYFVGDFPIKREDLVLRTLHEGSQVVGGTVLGRTAQRGLRFRVRPAGKGAPAVDPRPILDGWRLLEDTEVYRGKAFRTMGVRNPSIGQLMLMSKEALVRRVLADRRIRIYECGRRDVATGIIDRRVLVTLAYLAASNLKPRVSALQCGHSYYTSGGSVSWHSSGNAADIASINGTPILGHQGKGSTDVTIRRLLTLQGTMRPRSDHLAHDVRGAPRTRCRCPTTPHPRRLPAAQRRPDDRRRRRAPGHPQAEAVDAAGQAPGPHRQPAPQGRRELALEACATGAWAGCSGLGSTVGASTASTRRRSSSAARAEATITAPPTQYAVPMPETSASCAVLSTSGRSARWRLTGRRPPRTGCARAARPGRATLPGSRGSSILSLWMVATIVAIIARPTVPPTWRMVCITPRPPCSAAGAAFMTSVLAGLITSARHTHHHGRDQQAP